MPIYKVKGKKEGLQKYHVRINYLSDRGIPKQLTRVAYGIDKAKLLEARLYEQIKIEDRKPVRKMTVRELYNEFIEVKKYEVKKTTLSIIRQNIDYYVFPTLINYRIDKITVGDIQNWKMSFEKTDYAYNTKKKAFTIFSSMINYAIKMEYLQSNPLSKIGNFKRHLEIKPQMQFYAPDEFQRFIAISRQAAEMAENENQNLSEWNYYVFFNIAFYLGLRKGEIYALKWTDINGSYLTVSRTLTQRFEGCDGETAPKNKSSIRSLQMPLPLINILNTQKQRQQTLHTFTDEFRICGGVRDSSVQRKNVLYSTKAGLKTIRLHDFRHTHASVLTNEGVNIQEVARRLGHARIEMTLNTYSHLYPREEDKAVSVLNDIY